MRSHYLPICASTHRVVHTASFYAKPWISLDAHDSELSFHKRARSFARAFAVERRLSSVFIFSNIFFTFSNKLKNCHEVAKFKRALFQPHNPGTDGWMTRARASARRSVGRAGVESVVAVRARRCVRLSVRARRCVGACVGARASSKGVGRTRRWCRRRRAARDSGRRW